MPWIIPSHPAPALALKRLWPRAFSGLALALGTIAPDLEFILRWSKKEIISHDIAGQIVFTVPCVLLLYWSTTDLLVPFLLPYLPSGQPMHLEDLAALKRPSGAEWWTVMGCGALGGLSHIFLDGFTHAAAGGGWAVDLVPILATPVPWPGGPTPIYEALQLVLSALLGAFSLSAWLAIARGRELLNWRGLTPAPAPSPAPRAARRTLQGWLALSMLTCGLLAPAIRGASGAVAFELGIYGALSGVFYGLVTAALGQRLGDMWSSRPSRSPTG
jgi:hypothetical protein